MARILAIGDIHGCSTAFDTLLTLVGLRPDDTLVTLGDYCDRGPDTRGVFDRLVALAESHHLVALRGNHDVLMLNARQSQSIRQEWEQVGGDATVASYGTLSAVPEAHWRFIEDRCLDYWECETHFFVHGGVYPDVPLWEQPAHKLHWGRFDGAQPHASGKIMVCGHTSQKDGLPRDLGYAVCLDTWAYGGGWLSCLDVGTGDVWQADQVGRVRRFRLGSVHGPRR